MAGNLSITVPDTTTLSSGARGSTVSNVDTFGTVTVTDQRGANPATWSATVLSTAFAATGLPTIPDIPASAVTYTPGTATTGDGTSTPTTRTLSGTAQEVYNHAAGTGGNTASWLPDLAVAIPGRPQRGGPTAGR